MVISAAELKMADRLMWSVYYLVQLINFIQEGKEHTIANMYDCTSCDLVTLAQYGHSKLIISSMKLILRIKTNYFIPISRKQRNVTFQFLLGACFFIYLPLLPLLMIVCSWRRRRQARKRLMKKAARKRQRLLKVQ